MTNFESSKYEAEVTMSNNNKGEPKKKKGRRRRRKINVGIPLLTFIYFMGADRHHDLELNLSIGSLKGNDNMRSMQLNEATYELTNSGKRSKV